MIVSPLLTMHTLEAASTVDSVYSMAISMATCSSSYELVAGAPFLFRVVTMVGSSVVPVVMTDAAPPFVRPPEAEPSV